MHEDVCVIRFVANVKNQDWRSELEIHSNYLYLD